ncbi:hypothetical protein ACF1BU_35735 [Streptomyces sp. NPDC014724]|uniref:hypothetical protein n=1 Tax=unclassified Streptomyces TaxID=2593676 RepID=UPI0036F8B2BD
MPLTALRRTSGVPLSAALAAVTLIANAPQASAADVPSLRVLTNSTAPGTRSRPSGRTR